jgi:formamidopyrimidine-DNA glycosylase
MFVHTVETERKHLRAAFHLDGGTVCFFDPRRFGTIELFNSRADMPTVGVDPTESTFTQAQLSALLSGRKQPLKLWLLRQDAICGIGNIYASEILFRAKLSPFRLASRVKPKEVSLLYRSIRRVLAEAIERCGTTFSDFQDSNGEVGGFGAFLRVYDREGLKCRVCREEEILRHTQSQRSTYYCPSCQR